VKCPTSRSTPRPSWRDWPTGRCPPTIAQTARLALASATIPAPQPDSAHSDQLRLRGAGIPFPYWGKAGWETAGARIDTLDGRRIVTVFYKDAADVEVGYAIVSGPALRAITGTSRTVRRVRFTLRRQGHAELVTWQRDGHTCVLAGPPMAYSTLLSLASGGGGSAADWATSRAPPRRMRRTGAPPWRRVAPCARAVRCERHARTSESRTGCQRRGASHAGVAT
jgi:hypothetical protein